MNVRLWITFAMLAASSAGCAQRQQNKAFIQTLNAEKLAMEDIIFEQDYELQRLREDLERCREKSAGGEEKAGVRSRQTPASQDQGPSLSPPDITPPDFSPPDISPPQITPGERVDPRELSPLENGPGERSPLSPAPGPPDAAEAGGDASVVDLVINASRTGGRNLDDAPGDDALEIALEPRDAQGRIVRLARPISLVLLDPALPSEASRVARWDFSQQEVEVALQHAGTGRSIRLEAVWPKRPPQHSRLRLFARYATNDGRFLETDEMIHVDVAGGYSARWTPRPDGEYPSAEQARSERNSGPTPAVRSAGLVPWTSDRPKR